MVIHRPQHFGSLNFQQSHVPIHMSIFESYFFCPQIPAVSQTKAVSQAMDRHDIMEPRAWLAVKKEPSEEDGLYSGRDTAAADVSATATVQLAADARDGCQASANEVKQEPVERLPGAEPSECSVDSVGEEGHRSSAVSKRGDASAEMQESQPQSPQTWPAVKIEMDVADTEFLGAPTEEHAWQADLVSHCQPACSFSDHPQDSESVKQELPVPKAPVRIKLKTEPGSPKSDLQQLPWEANAVTGQKNDAPTFSGEQHSSVKTERGVLKSEYVDNVLVVHSHEETLSSMGLRALSKPNATGQLEDCADTSNNNDDKEEGDDDDDDSWEEDDVDDNVVSLPVSFQSGDGMAYSCCESDTGAANALAQTEDIDRDLFQCGACQQSYGDPAQLRQHMVNAHGCQVSARCTLCVRMFKCVSYLVKHVKHRTALRQHQCGSCSRAFKCVAHLRRHQRSHSGEKPYMCPFCPAAFSHSTNLKNHVRTHTGEKPYRCESCPAAFKRSSTLKRHVLSMHNSERSYRCKVCQRTFLDALELKEHRTVHRREKTYVCDLCPAKFYSSSHLSGHKTTHSGEKPFACRQCPATFKRSSHLRIHQRIHSGEKPFKCEHCPKAFSDASNLKTHFRTHSGEKPFKCDQCQAAFKQSSSLKSHKRRHTPKRKAKLCS